MKTFLVSVLIAIAMFTNVYGQKEAPQKSLNQYVAFLNESTKAVTERFQMLIRYQDETNRFRKKNDYEPRLSSSGPLEEYYYKKALAFTGVSAGEKQNLNHVVEEIWQLLNQIDQSGKSLETYVRLKDYKTDNLKRSDILVTEIQSGLERFSTRKDAFYKQIQQVYQQHQPYSATDPYLTTEREMEAILIRQRELINSLPFYLNEENRSEWPLEIVQKSMLADEKSITDFGKQQSKLAYPASDMIGSFKSALQSLQSLKSQAVDNHNFAARQSAVHGNAVYLSLINQYNNDLLASHKSFVSYSQSARQLLDFPTFSPVFAHENIGSAAKTSGPTPPFEDKPLISFSTKKSPAPLPAAVERTLNDYVEYINESLRQMHLIQVLLRNYQSSAEYYRDPSRSRSRANLTYSHDDFKVPVSAYQLLITASVSVPPQYRPAINSQAEVLLNMLKEMDGLSIELIAYTTEKQYLQDQLQRSDEILDRYRVLFNKFDQKKEQLYNDARRIFESYPTADTKSSWYISGSAMLKTMDDDKEALFGVKDFLKGDSENLPGTVQLEADARQLIADEYQNMKGLQRYGRSNGLCPYSPYEDLAGNSTRFAEKAQKLKLPLTNQSTHPYESFYYFYNNELVYQYNKFVELAKSGLLKMVNQPDVFAFRRQPDSQLTRLPGQKEFEVKKALPEKRETLAAMPDAQTAPLEETPKSLPSPSSDQIVLQKRDTVYVERVRVDTVFVDRGNGNSGAVRSLKGFAANNMVLLLDVSASMDSPFKLPLLKRSIKSLLTLVRPEDKLSIVLYSGKARVVLKPTSGAKAAEIGRMIDLLQSSGDTDGNEGIRLAYKVANKEYIRGGNNRIVLATDGEFPVSDEVMDMIGQNARQDVYLTVFTFGRNQLTGKKLKKLSQLGLGTYAHVTAESADLQLILEAQAKKQPAK